MTYAPSAPAVVWSIPSDILNGQAKVTLMWLWSKADHAVQRDPDQTTVWVAARDGMSPVESVRADIAEGTGCTTRMARSHLTLLRKLGLVRVCGRLITLFAPDIAAASWADLSETARKPATDGRQTLTADRQRCQETGDGWPADSDSGPAATDSKPAQRDGKPSLQLNPPTPPTTTQHPPTPDARSQHHRDSTPHPPPPGQVPLIPLDTPPPKSKRSRQRTADSPDPTDPAPRQIRDWWADTYLPIRAETFARWRPEAQTHPLTCTDERVKDIRSRLHEYAKGQPWERQREVLTHVVRAAALRVDRQRGESVPYGTGTYDTMRNILPDYWLRRGNFTSLAEETLPAATAEPKREEIPRWLQSDRTFEDSRW